MLSPPFVHQRSAAARIDRGDGLPPPIFREPWLLPVAERARLDRHQQVAVDKPFTSPGFERVGRTNPDRRYNLGFGLSNPGRARRGCEEQH